MRCGDVRVELAGGVAIAGVRALGACTAGRRRGGRDSSQCEPLLLGDYRGLPRGASAAANGVGCCSRAMWGRRGAMPWGTAILRLLGGRQRSSYGPFCVIGGFGAMDGSRRVRGGGGWRESG